MKREPRGFGFGLRIGDVGLDRASDEIQHANIQKPKSDESGAVPATVSRARPAPMPPPPAWACAASSRLAKTPVRHCDACCLRLPFVGGPRAGVVGRRRAEPGRELRRRGLPAPPRAVGGLGAAVLGEPGDLPVSAFAFACVRPNALPRPEVAASGGRLHPPGPEGRGASCSSPPSARCGLSAASRCLCAAGVHPPTGCPRGVV